MRFNFVLSSNGFSIIFTFIVECIMYNKYNIHLYFMYYALYNISLFHELLLMPYKTTNIHINLICICTLQYCNNHFRSPSHAELSCHYYWPFGINY